MEILENLAGWQEAFENGWYKTYQETGKMDWSLYNRPTNQTAPAGKAVDLSKSKIGLISSGGFYLPATQFPYDAEHDLGDYSMRRIPWDTPFAEMAIAHTHYDHTAVNQDPQVLWPTKHLSDLVAEGVIGAVADHAFSFSGFLPMAHRTVTELIPKLVNAAQEEQIDAAFLVPS